MNLLIPNKINWKPFLLFVIVFPSMLESSASEKNAAQMARYVNCQPYACYTHTHTHTGCIFTWHTSQNCSEKGMKNIPILLG